MLCDNCKQNEATVHMTRVVNGKKTERHLCNVCAAKQPNDGFGSQGFMNFGPSLLDNDFFTNDFFTNTLYPDSLLNPRQETRCSQCGMTFSEFNQTGKFGCDHCYDTFEAQIAPLVKRLQGSLSYEGRVPSRGTGVFKTKHQIKRLRQELDKAVKAEQFEEAVRLRDEIKVLEESLNKENK
ncbi:MULTISPECIES: UvrB/UvrC motif-containing protein [unclassified Veillonella]|uniref:UvrB/UvrC motif-containing protein n=1 Tax=unclassified Veillonella TaxID=2630086 RepID=UPI0013897AD0|nr:MULTISPECIES: UvrB/UvrC motif-containing protein [unclassified Veillonella]KAF1679157.1 DNA helicase UvrB [Veillonella sp. R32]